MVRARPSGSQVQEKAKYMIRDEAGDALMLTLFNELAEAGRWGAVPRASVVGMCGTVWCLVQGACSTIAALQSLGAWVRGVSRRPHVTMRACAVEWPRARCVCDWFRARTGESAACVLRGARD